MFHSTLQYTRVTWPLVSGYYQRLDLQTDYLIRITFSLNFLQKFTSNLQQFISFFISFWFKSFGKPSRNCLLIHISFLRLSLGKGRSNWIWCYYGKLLWGWTSALIVNFKKPKLNILFCFRYGVQWGEIQQRRKMSNIFLYIL